ncbi:MAG: Gfo/Idh/MocA family protein [Kineosporiaceae bacterium]
MRRAPRPPRVGLVGPGGHGRVHLAALLTRHGAGRLRLVAVADRPGAEPPELPEGARYTTDWRGLLGGGGLDVAVLATPPHLHLEMALVAFEAGLDVLLEKPAALAVADLDRLIAAAAAAGVLCQVGFQSLGSTALDRLCAALAEGELGEVTAVGVVGAWRRSTRYYRRTPWAGRLLPDGRPGDGTVVNPFSHAVVNALVVAGAAHGRDAHPGPGRADVAAELYRANDIEVDDTASLRLRTTDGVVVTLAVTLAADELVDPVVRVRGTRGTASLWYQDDVLALGGHTHRWREERVDLLDDLLAVRERIGRGGRPGGSWADGGVRCPPERTRPALDSVERALAAGGPPVPLPAAAVGHVTAPDGSPAVVVPGVAAALESCVAGGLLLSGTGVPWAAVPRPAHQERRPSRPGGTPSGPHVDDDDKE